MSLLVIDFTYLEVRDVELVVKELAAVDSQSNRVSSYVFKKPYGWEEVPPFNARMNQAIDHGCNWNGGDVLYSELQTVLHREASSAVAIFCFGPEKTHFISSLIERAVIDITTRMPSNRRHKSAWHQLHVCMSQQVQTCLCIADILFISTVA